MIVNSQRKCPICGYKLAKILHSINFVLPDDVRLPRYYDLVACCNCKFVYADTLASQNDYDAYYEYMSKYTEPGISSGGGETAWDKNRLLRVANDLGRYIDKQASVLDVGCANGGLLTILYERGYKNLTGLDKSIFCVNHIKNINGIRAIHGGLFDLEFKEEAFSNEKFDVVILSHVLEHVLDIQLAFDFLDKKLQQNGLLYIETPDASNYHEFPNVPFYYLDSEHINHFDLARLTLLLQSRGYNIEVFIQKAIEVSENSLYPAISVMGRKSEIAAEVKDEVNQLSEDIIISIIQHIKQSTHLQHFNIIDSLADSQEQLVVFGVGSYTSRLLGSSRLNECNIVAFIDNDTVKQGTTVMGIHVYSPEYLRKNDCSVLVCSALHADKMVKQIADMNIKRNIYFPILEGI